MKELQAIQQQLSCPKEHRNDYGKFMYRTCGDILDAFKKVANGCSIVISDNIIEVGGAIFVEATATIIAPDGARESCKGYAQVGDPKGAMDSAQWTGACSSYARKYALNGLLAIDDTADNDALTPEEPQPTKSKKKPEVKPKEELKPTQATQAAPDKNKYTITDDMILQLIQWANWEHRSLADIKEMYELTSHQFEEIAKQIH